MAKKDKNLRGKIFGAEETSAAAMGEELREHDELAVRMFHTPVLTTRERLIPAFSSMGRKLADMLDGNYRKLYIYSILRMDMKYMVLIESLISIYDVLNNPLMGIAYDKTRTRWGKSRPYILFAPIFYFACIAMLFFARFFFNNDDPHDMNKVLYVFVMLFIKETFSTIYSIPQGNFVALMSPNPQDRMSVGLWQTYFQKWGGDFIAGLILPIIELGRLGVLSVSPASVFAAIGIITSVIGAGSNVMMAINCRERVIIQPRPAPVSKTLFYVLKNKYLLRQVVAEFFISWWNDGGYQWDVVTQTEIFGGSFRGGLFAYLPRQVMQLVSLSLVERFKRMFKGEYRKTVLFMRVWDVALDILNAFIGSRKFSIKRVWVVSSIFALFDGLVVSNDAPSIVLEQEIGREIQDYTEYMTGERPDGTVTLLTDLIKKVTTPLNAMMTLAVFRWSGYNVSIGGNLSKNWSQQTVRDNYKMYARVYMLYNAGSFLPRIVKMIPLLFYDLYGKKKEEMYIELNERRALLAKTEQRINEIGKIAERETEV